MYSNWLAEAVTAFCSIWLGSGDAWGRTIRRLALQSACGTREAFQALAGLLNITPDEVRDSGLFYNCDSLELLKLLAEEYEISKDDAVRAFHQACTEGSKDRAIWLAEQFQLTKDDVLSPAHCRNGYTITASGNLAFIKWLVEKYQLTPADMELRLTYVIGSRPELVRWFGSNFEFERDDVVEAFVGACGWSLETAQWLVDKYQLTPTEIRSNANKALRFCDDAYVRDWLVENYYSTQIRQSEDL